MSKVGERLPNKMVFVGNCALSSLSAPGLSEHIHSGEDLKIESSEYVESTIPAELETLLHDCKELEEMNQNTMNVEKQISARIILLKEELRAFIEQALDVPVTLDGELLTYETVSKGKKQVEEELEMMGANWLREIGAFDENNHTYYYYTIRTIYQLDVEEECMMNLIRFINSKKTPTPDEIIAVLKSYREAKTIAYGYRTAYLTCIDEKAEIGKNRETTVYTGTIFNNTEYSLRVTELIEKILLKIKMDYIERTKSTYLATSYVTDCVDSKWLIIHKETGATDLLSESESRLCTAVQGVQDCLNSQGILMNDKKTDFQVETLQGVLEEYLKENNEKQK